MVAHMVQNSSFYLQRKFYFIQRNIFIFRKNLVTFRETFSYSEKILLHPEKHFHIQSDFLIFKEIQYIQRNCIFKETFLHSEKVFISIEIVFIQRNVFYPKKMLILKKIGTFRENLKLKFQIIYHSRVSSCIFDIHKEN